MKEVPECAFLPVELNVTAYSSYSMFALKSWSIDVPIKILKILSIDMQGCLQKRLCVFVNKVNTWKASAEEKLFEKNEFKIWLASENR